MLVEDEEALAARRVVEQAAALLRKKFGLNEGESYRKISMLALSHRQSLRGIAEAIVLADELSVENKDQTRQD